MKREKIQRLVLEYLSHAQYRSVDCAEEEMNHFIAILTDCTDYVIRHGKGTSGGNQCAQKGGPR